MSGNKPTFESLSPKTRQSKHLNTDLLISLLFIILMFLISVVTHDVANNKESTQTLLTHYQLSWFSIGLVSQLLPGLSGRLIAKNSHPACFIFSSLSGLVLWSYFSLNPYFIQLSQYSWIDTFWLSIAANIIIFLLFYALSSKKQLLNNTVSPHSRILKNEQVDIKSNTKNTLFTHSSLRLKELIFISKKFIGKKATEDILLKFYISNKSSPNTSMAPLALIRHIESKLASLIGEIPATTVIQAAIDDNEIPFLDGLDLISKISTNIQYNQILLLEAINCIHVGMAVLNKNHELIRWNQKLVDLFSFPKGFIALGASINEYFTFILKQTLLPSSAIQQQTAFYLNIIRKNQSFEVEIILSDGRCFLTQGSLIPSSGYAITFTDISQLKKTTQELIYAKRFLENRVNERTRELDEINREQHLLNKKLTLLSAKQQSAKEEAEKANLSKSRFLAAASHDLLQPLNAARLFISTLQQLKLDEEISKKQERIINYLDSALLSAEDILSSLLDISKLDSGVLQVIITEFRLADMMNELHTEFSALAASNGNQLKSFYSSISVLSDKRLLRRACQNLLSNAIRYTKNGKILFGIRRKSNGYISIEVWDNGPGIPFEHQKTIFEEFKRFNQDGQSNGLGLGLSIVERISQVLSHPIHIRSIPGKGTGFSLQVPRAGINEEPLTGFHYPVSHQNIIPDKISSLSITCIDDDITILTGMQALLENWGCQVTTINSFEGGLKKIEAKKFHSDIVIVDYELSMEAEKNGLSLLKQMKLIQAGHFTTGILITAQRDTMLKKEVSDEGFQILYKPLKPALLRALLEMSSRKKTSSENKNAQARDETSLKRERSFL